MTDKTEWVMVPKEALGLVLDTAMAAHVSNGASSISMPDECVELAAILAGIAAAPTPPAQEAHPDDKAVDRFAAAMKAKLAEARSKGRNGWDDLAWEPEEISAALRKHVEKGDPRDVANYCMFLWARGARIEPAQEAQPLFILHTGAFFGNEQDEWEVEAISQERVDDYCRERSSQHDPLYTIPPDAARRIAELEAQVENQIESLRFHHQRVDDLAAAYSKREAEREAERDRWIALYRRAVNEANGLTNYVEDRPELRSAEKKLTVIEAEARAALGRES